MRSLIDMNMLMFIFLSEFTFVFLSGILNLLYILSQSTKYKLKNGAIQFQEDYSGPQWERIH